MVSVLKESHKFYMVAPTIVSDTDETKFNPLAIYNYDNTDRNPSIYWTKYVETTAPAVYTCIDPTIDQLKRWIEIERQQKQPPLVRFSEGELIVDLSRIYIIKHTTVTVTTERFQVVETIWEK